MLYVDYRLSQCCILLGEGNGRIGPLFSFGAAVFEGLGAWDLREKRDG